MQNLEYACAAMLALSTVNCPILKIIHYCELCNTQNSFVHSNTLPYAELRFLACMYNLKTLFYIDIQGFVARNALWLRSTHCNTALRSFSTQHCKSQYIGQFFRAKKSRKHQVRLYNSITIHRVPSRPL